MTHLSPEAARMARARKDFVEAMARGCSIIDLRAARAGCSRRVERESPAEEQAINGKQGFVVIDEAADFDRWDCQHMMRGLTVKKPRYITYYGYFGLTSNVKDAPVALTSDVVARLLGAVPPRPEKGGVK